MKVVERGNTLARIFNTREGFTEKDDWLPPRFFQSKTSGALNKTSVDPRKLRKAKLTYYDMMGWDEHGVPKQSTLEELDIAWAVNKLSAQ
jgi:aldehyde:ferredoxin oxidoreductase